jgi:Protein of unknown function (DUF2934)
MNRRIDEPIAARAYELWEQAGKPEGRDEHFWHLAEQELINDALTFTHARQPLSTPLACSAVFGWFCLSPPALFVFGLAIPSSCRVFTPNRPSRAAWGQRTLP